MDSGPLIPSNGQILREVQSPYPVELNRTVAQHIYPALPMQESGVREYMRVLVKRKWIILSCVAAIFALVAVATLRSTRIYDAWGAIAINKSEPSILNFKDSQNGNEFDDPSDLDTEVSILKSDAVAREVIEKLNLRKRPEFGGSGDASSNSLAVTTDSQPDSAQASSLLDAFKGNLQVTLRPNTRIIDIHYRSADKDFAATAVNSLIDIYREQNIRSRFTSTEQTSNWLQDQLKEMKIKVEQSQNKLVEYQKEHQIFGIDDKQNITTSKLDELNKELTSAESDRMEKESVYRLVQSGDPDTALTAASSVDSGGSGASSTSGLLEKLREQQADLKIQIAQLSTQFGPSYPKLAQLNNQLKEVDAQVQGELKKVVGRIRGDYTAALQRENMLRAALEGQKKDANTLNQSAIVYNELKREAETNRTLYEGLLQKLGEAQVSSGLKSNNFRVVDRARVPTEPSEPNVPRNLAFALALGLSTGIGMAFLLEGIDNTVRTPEQAQAISGLPSLGMIPFGSRGSLDNDGRQRLSVAASREAVELVTQTRPQSQMAEAYRALRTSLLLTSSGGPPKVILVTSALPQEGKSTTSINTAIVLAQKGARVLLIDADLRRPSIHKSFGLGPRAGLSNVLTGNTTLQLATVRSPLLPSLFILPAGTPPPNPAELLASANMGDVITELLQHYDHIVIDTPPTLSVTDAVIMSTRSEAVVLVIRAGQTTKQALRRARDLLTQVNARVCGVLLNAVDLNSPDYYYYYEYQGKYGKRYYQEDGEDESNSLAPTSSTGD
jgi:succinoglycan biosynthesis transport protein ExoP